MGMKEYSSSPTNRIDNDTSGETCYVQNYLSIA